ncbi:MAG: rhomboid family intramembrane serine protease [Mucilaginibacter sp.]
MAFGLFPKYIVGVSIEDLTPSQFLVILIEAGQQLGYDFRYVARDGFVAYTGFSMSSASEEITVKIEGDLASLKSECTGNQLVDWGKNKRNIDDLNTQLKELKSKYSAEELDQKYEALQSDFFSDETGRLNTPLTVNKGKLANLLTIFWPSKGYTITPIIIDLNIVIFILMVISGVDILSPSTESLITWGANFAPATLEGEWWRLLSNCFLHIGLLHLLFNMYALLYIGLILEPYLGKLRFTTAYLLTGIVASTSSLYVHDQTVSAGASGAIFGMYGVFLAMLTTNIIPSAVRKALISSIAIFVVFNLINGMKAGIDNAAHIGGLVSGFIIGYLYYPSLKADDRMDLKLGSIGLLSIFIIASCYFVLLQIPNYIGQYKAKMKTFSAMESMALEVYSMPKNTSRDSLLHEIKDRGIYYWNQDIDLLNDVENLKLSDQLHQRDRSLIRYCNLRIKVYNLIYKAIDENTPKYNDSIAGYNKTIVALIDSLKN